MKQIKCPKCGIIKSFCRVEHLSRFAYYDVNDDLVDTSDAELTYTGVPKCPKCNSKVYYVDDAIAVLDTLKRYIANKEETLDGFLMHPGTVATVLAVIDEYIGGQHGQEDDPHNAD